MERKEKRRKGEEGRRIRVGEEENGRSVEKRRRGEEGRERGGGVEENGRRRGEWEESRKG